MAMQDILQQLMAAKGAHEAAISKAQEEVKAKAEALVDASNALKVALDALAAIPPA